MTGRGERGCKAGRLPAVFRLLGPSDAPRLPAVAWEAPQQIWRPRGKEGTAREGGITGWRGMMSASG
jgi:hypothetical protein